MSTQEKTQEEVVPLVQNSTTTDNPFDNDVASKNDSETDNFGPEQICSMILASNRLDANRISPPNRLAELWSSANPSPPFRLLDLPIEIRLMIYHFAIGNHYLHIYSNCDTIPGKIIQCNDEHPHACLESKLNLDLAGFPLNPRYMRAEEERVSENVVHCQGSVFFHNRICTSRGINVGDRNGYWSLSLSHEVQTGLKTVEYGTRDNAKSANAKSLDYCPCIHRTKTSLSLNLLRTCKRIHEEAAMMPYESNTFIFQETETFAAFFGLVYPKESDSNDCPTFPCDRSDAIYNMRSVRLHSRVMTSQHLCLVTRILRAGLSLLAGLQKLEFTLGLLPFKMPVWAIDDSLFGVSRSVKKVTVNIRDYIWLARECDDPDLLSIRDVGTWTTSMEGKHEFAAMLMERILKMDGFSNEMVPFFGPEPGETATFDEAWKVSML